MKQFNEWWGRRSFPEMEKITRLGQADFDPEDGCQSFVDACDHWWYSLPAEEKKSIAEEYDYE